MKKTNDAMADKINHVILLHLILQLYLIILILRLLLEWSGTVGAIAAGWLSSHNGQSI